MGRACSPEQILKPISFQTPFVMLFLNIISYFISYTEHFDPF